MAVKQYEIEDHQREQISEFFRRRKPAGREKTIVLGVTLFCALPEVELRDGICLNATI